MQTRLFERRCQQPSVCLLPVIQLQPGCWQNPIEGTVFKRGSLEKNAPEIGNVWSAAFFFLFCFPEKSFRCARFVGKGVFILCFVIRPAGKTSGTLKGPSDASCFTLYMLPVWKPLTSPFTPSLCVSTGCALVHCLALAWNNYTCTV